jgi:hypothetical protein
MGIYWAGTSQCRPSTPLLLLLPLLMALLMHGAVVSSAAVITPHVIPHTTGLLAVAVLALCGFLAYQSAPRPCAESPRYIHATIVQQQEAAAAALGSSKGSEGCSKAAAAAAAGPAAAGVDLSLLPRLLPFTNFASLKSVDLLDPAVAANQDPQVLKQLMQLHSKLFCA